MYKRQLLSLVGGAVLAVVGFAAARPLLEIMGSPEDVIDLAELYIRIIFVGMPVQMLYNFCAAVLRAVGDTKRPLYFLTIAGVINAGPVSYTHLSRVRLRSAR